jgi:hypothetical protein
MQNLRNDHEKRLMEAQNPTFTGRQNRERTVAMFKNEYLNREQMKASQAEEDHHYEEAKGREDGESMRGIATRGLKIDKIPGQGSFCIQRR